MRTALDSSVLLAIFNDEPGAGRWMETLIATRREGQLLICEIVYAEVSPAFSERSHLESALGSLGARLDPIQAESAWLAGQTFLAYRRAGGPREHLVPDFLIAAHAQVQADRLAALDRGYFRQCFPELTLLTPKAS
jgi:predicted nucleic acid-binding protein